MVTNTLKTTLEQKLERVIKRANGIQEELSAKPDSDADDNAIDSEDDEVLALLANKTQSDIASVRLALARLSMGGGNCCARCGAVIPAERLEILPDTCYCVRCA